MGFTMAFIKDINLQVIRLFNESNSLGIMMLAWRECQMMRGQGIKVLFLEYRVLWS